MLPNFLIPLVSVNLFQLNASLDDVALRHGLKPCPLGDCSSLAQDFLLHHLLMLQSEHVMWRM